MGLLGTKGMQPCPHNLTAWQCTYYVFCAGYKLCQDKRRKQGDEDEYCGKTVDDCKGYEIDKRYKQN